MKEKDGFIGNRPSLFRKLHPRRSLLNSQAKAYFMTQEKMYCSCSGVLISGAGNFSNLPGKFFSNAARWKWQAAIPISTL